MGSRSGKRKDITVTTYMNSLKRTRVEEKVGDITVTRVEYRQQKQKKIKERFNR